MKIISYSLLVLLMCAMNVRAFDINDLSEDTDNEIMYHLSVIDKESLGTVNRLFYKLWIENYKDHVVEMVVGRDQLENFFGVANNKISILARLTVEVPFTDEIENIFGKIDTIGKNLIGIHLKSYAARKKHLKALSKLPFLVEVEITTGYPIKDSSLIEFTKDCNPLRIFRFNAPPYYYPKPTFPEQALVNVVTSHSISFLELQNVVLKRDVQMELYSATYPHLAVIDIKTTPDSQFLSSAIFDNILLRMPKLKSLTVHGLTSGSTLSNSIVKDLIKLKLTELSIKGGQINIELNDALALLTSFKGNVRAARGANDWQNITASNLNDETSSCSLAISTSADEDFNDISWVTSVVRQAPQDRQIFAFDKPVHPKTLKQVLTAMIEQCDNGVEHVTHELFKKGNSIIEIKPKQANSSTFKTCVNHALLNKFKLGKQLPDNVDLFNLEICKIRNLQEVLKYLNRSKHQFMLSVNASPRHCSDLVLGESEIEQITKNGQLTYVKLKAPYIFIERRALEKMAAFYQVTLTQSSFRSTLEFTKKALMSDAEQESNNTDQVRIVFKSMFDERADSIFSEYVNDRYSLTEYRNITFDGSGEEKIFENFRQTIFASFY